MFRSVVSLVVALVLFSSRQLGAQEAVLGQLYGSGVHAYFAEDYLKAHQYFTSAIDGHTQDPRCFYFRGLALRKLGRTQDAEIDFQQGAKLESAIDPTRAYNVARGLERVQGPERTALEQFRMEARMAVLKKAEDEHKVRYDDNRKQERDFLQKQADVAPPKPVEGNPNMPKPDATAPDGSGVVPGKAAAPAVPADPFATSGDATKGPDKTPDVKEAVPAKEDKKAVPGGEADPFGAGAAPAKEDKKMPAGDKPAPAGPGGEADPFGAGAAPAKEGAAPAKEDKKAAPAGESDPFGAGAAPAKEGAVPATEDKKMPEGDKPAPKGAGGEADPFGAGAAPAAAKEDGKAAPGGVAEKPTVPAQGGLTAKSSVSGGLFSALKKSLGGDSKAAARTGPAAMPVGPDAGPKPGAPTTQPAGSDPFGAVAPVATPVPAVKPAPAKEDKKAAPAAEADPFGMAAPAEVPKEDAKPAKAAATPFVEEADKGAGKKADDAPAKEPAKEPAKKPVSDDPFGG